ncbi:MAG TPA: DMT family transporter [bacterium]|jgi:drug/metabolite transporter (DMT)-like permease
MLSSIPHFGEILSLSTAVVWAFAVILFKKSGETVHPIALNLFKNTLGVLLFIPTLWLAGEDFFRPVPVQDYLLLLLSGALGIGIADTFFFMSLNLLGAGLSAIVDCLYSPFVIATAMLWLGERLKLLQIVGVCLIVSAVLEATLRRHSSHISRRNLWLGILFGALSMAIMAVGIVMVKPLLEQSPVLWVTEVRLIGGALTLCIVLLFHKQRRDILKSALISRGWGYMFSSSFIGAYLSLMLWIGGMKYAQASVSAALNQTSNVLVFVFAAIFLHERITRQRAFGILLAVAGVYLVTFG